MAYKEQLFVKSNDMTRILSGEFLKTSDKLEVGTYKLCFSQFLGFFLTSIDDIKPAVDKIYGKSGLYTEHLLKYFEMTEDNVGVLLSGDKGLGKSLMSKLLSTKAKERYGCPIIYVDEYFPNMKDFLSNLRNCVIIFDEFEKTFGEQDERQTRFSVQNELLTFFDGTSANKTHNLYVLIANELYNVSPYLLGRPGRLRYHYKFSGITYEDVVEYCKDNLEDFENSKDFMKSLTKYVSRSKSVSFDVLSNIVSEYNMFRTPLKEILEVMNLSDDDKNRLEFSFKVQYEKAYWKQFDIDNESDSVEVLDRGFDISLISNEICETWCGSADGYIVSEPKDIEVRQVGLMNEYYLDPAKCKVPKGVNILQISVDKPYSKKAEYLI